MTAAEAKALEHSRVAAQWDEVFRDTERTATIYGPSRPLDKGV